MQFLAEPGYYEDGKFGCRIENLVLIVKADTKVKLEFVCVFFFFFFFCSLETYAHSEKVKVSIDQELVLSEPKYHPKAQLGKKNRKRQLGTGTKRTCHELSEQLFP